MYLYIDIENLLSLIKAHKDPLYNDCIKVIQKQLSVFFNFSKKDFKDDEMLLAWFQLLSEGVGKTNLFSYLDEHKFPPRPLTKDCHVGFSANKLSSIYLLNDADIEFAKKEGALLIGSVGEEIITFNKIFLQQNDYDFHKDLKIGDTHFTKWDDGNKFALPLTDIIFIDSYILTDSSLIETNFIKLLQVLATNSRTLINITLYANNKHISIAFASLHKKVIESVEKITGVKPNFTMILYSDQRSQESLAEHDRTIFTNYVRIKSGDTYNYFNSAGKVITKGREISYISLGKKENHDLANKLLVDLQKNIDFIKSNSKEIHGDKKSNFLSLS